VCALDQVDGVLRAARSTLTSWTVMEIINQIPFVPIKTATPVSDLQNMNVQRSGVMGSARAGNLQWRRKLYLVIVQRRGATMLVLNIQEKRIVMEISFLIHIVKTIKGRKELYSQV